jgi:hypothetical protein
VFRPIPADRQAAAVRFLVENGFSTPQDLLLPSILNRIQSTGTLDLVLSGQRRLLSVLLDNGRLGRLQDMEAQQGPQSYTILRLVWDIQNGIWSDLTQTHPAIDLYRRNLQRAYLDIVKGKLSGPSVGDYRAIATDALRQLAHRIDPAIPRTSDPMTRLHLEDCRKAIERILEPKSEPAPSPVLFMFGAASGSPLSLLTQESEGESFQDADPGLAGFLCPRP